MESTVPKSTSRVIKKLGPQAPGARQWAATYDEQLVCVRYRVDPLRQCRQTTVEIVVDEAPTLNSVRVGVRVAWGEKEMARKAREAGGIWDPDGKLRMMTLGQANETGLVERVVMGGCQMRLTCPDVDMPSCGHEIEWRKGALNMSGWPTSR